MKFRRKQLALPLVGIFALLLILIPQAAHATESPDANTTLLSQDQLDQITESLDAGGAGSEGVELQSAPSSKLVVALDAGHGGSDSGAVGFYVEKNINLRIALACAQELETKGVQAVLIRDSDTELFSTNAALELQARCTKAYRAGANVYVSLHCNSGNGSANGAEVWYPQNVPYNNNCYTTGRGLARTILDKLTENNKYGIRPRGIYTRDYNEGGGHATYSDGHSSYDYYAVIRHSREYDIPGIIVEHGFIDNLSDAKSLNANAEAMGRDDADAICDYFNVSPVNSRWEHAADGRWKYWNGTEYVASSWQKVGTAWYWFDANGYAVSGWQTINGKRYHFSSTDAMDTGWFNDNGSWYWLGGPDDGSVAGPGWVQVNGAWYHFSASGVMDTGWLQEGGSRYWLGEANDGALASGWRLIDNTWYYLHDAHDGHFGELQTGWAQVNGAWYWLDTTTGAAARSTTVVVNGATYAFDDSCAMIANGWYQEGKNWYWAGPSGAFQSGWQKVNDSWYWMDPSTNAMVTGWRTINGTRYHFADSGAMTWGWFQEGDSWYWLGWPDDGSLQVGWHLVNGAWYYFDPTTGKMVTGWKDIDGARYYLQPGSGAMQTGHAVINGRAYDFNDSGALVAQSDTNPQSSNPAQDSNSKNDGNTQANTSNGGSNTPQSSDTKKDGEPIMGQSKATKADMVAFYKASGRSYPSSVYASKGAANINQFVDVLTSAAESEGVRPDVVFCQAMLETGYLQFGGDVAADQCNFAGIGATGNGNPGNTFTDVHEGLLAQVQHLKGYASTKPLNNACVDPRFEYLKNSRGIAPYVSDLSHRWAASDTYGNDITNMLRRLDNMS